MDSQKAIVLTMFALLAIATAGFAYTFQAGYADNGFTTDCSGPGNSGGSGDCPGGSEKSGPHDETVKNRGGNQPPGQQPDEPR